MAEVLSVTEDEAWQDLLLLYALQSQLQVLSRRSIVCLHIITQQAQHLHCVLQGGMEEGWNGYAAINKFIIRDGANTFMVKKKKK